MDGKVSGDQAHPSLHLWSKLLKEAQLNAQQRHQNFGGVSSKMNLIFLGKQFSGKSALIARLRNEPLVGERDSGAAFGYNYIDLKHAEGENPRRVHAWLLATTLGTEKQLRFLLNSKNIWNSLILICVSMGEPWEMEDSINQSLQLVEDHINQIQEVCETELAELQNSLERYFRGYIDPAISAKPGSTPSSPSGRRLSVVLSYSNSTSEGGDDEASERWQWNCLHPADPSDPHNPLPPLNGGACERKMRVPILIVVTKSDLIEHLQNVLGYNEEVFDAIQLRLRQMAFEIGAGLIYTSARKDTNIPLLNRYLQRRLFCEEFLGSAQILKQESIFIPTGWDTRGKMEGLPVKLSENLGGFPGKPSVKLRISLRNSARGFAPRGANETLKKEEVVEAMDEQTFLGRIFNKLSALEVSEKENWKQRTVEEDKIAERIHMGRSASIALGMEVRKRERRKRLETNAEEDEDEGEAAVLSNFFTTLLNKRHSMIPQPHTRGKQSESFSQDHRLAIEAIRLRARHLSSGDSGENDKPNRYDMISPVKKKMMEKIPSPSSEMEEAFREEDVESMVDDTKPDDEEVKQPLNQTEAPTVEETTEPKEAAENTSTPDYEQQREGPIQEEITDQESQNLANETEKENCPLFATGERSCTEQMKELTPSGTCEEETMNLDLHQEIRSETRKAEESEVQAGAVSEETVEATNVVTGGEAKEGAISSDGAHHQDETKPESEWELIVKGAKGVTAAESGIEAIPGVSELPQGIGTEAQVREREGQVETVPGEAVEEANVVTSRESEETTIPRDGGQHQGYTKEGLDEAPSDSKSEAKVEEVEEEATTEPEVRTIPTVGESQHEALRNNAVDDPTSAQKGEHTEDIEERQQEASKEGQDAAQPELKVAGVVEGTEERAAMEPEVEAIPVVVETEQGREFDGQSADEEPQKTEEKLGDTIQVAVIETQSKEPQNEALRADETDTSTATQGTEDDNKEHYQEARGEGQPKPKSEVMVEETNEGITAVPETEAVPVVGEREQENIFVDRSLDKVSRLAEDSLSALNQECTAFTVIDMQSNELHNKELKVSAIDDLTAAQRDEDKKEEVRSKEDEVLLTEEPLSAVKLDPSGANGENAREVQATGKEQPNHLEEDQTLLGMQEVKEVDTTGQDKEGHLEVCAEEVSDNQHLMEDTQGSTDGARDMEVKESTPTVVEETSGVDPDGASEKRGSSQNDVEAVSEGMTMNEGDGVQIEGVGTSSGETQSGTATTEQVSNQLEEQRVSQPEDQTAPRNESAKHGSQENCQKNLHVRSIRQVPLKFIRHHRQNQQTMKGVKGSRLVQPLMVFLLDAEGSEKHREGESYEAKPVEVSSKVETSCLHLNPLDQ
ncbi:Cytoplasmic dynein 1 light intermediate chain [Echinococcus granulosus]|uniref:Cytoplasmic dynein 1 light intermediate chain n=1 Tax=Echinococcus granulosus TaxID=6210 RepID=W6UF86_ECHGR|nr:Cytoplasmic dynein 1 light intermediate chain [Echinococcus granulosus]EUB59546.1 Cytoplasmic dynein 1 light intermediate chain [Echinococcus granulosus]